jgi:hypothetical protein
MMFPEISREATRAHGSAIARLAVGRGEERRLGADVHAASGSSGGYFVNALTVRPAGVLVAAACLVSVAQRRLSTPARQLRRRTAEVSGEQRFTDGQVRELTGARLSAPLESALSALSLAMVLLAAGLVAGRL